MQKKINFNHKNILITGGAGFIGSNLAFYFQDNYPESKIIVFDCFRNEQRFTNGNLKSFGHFNNLLGFKGDIICGNISKKNDLALLSDYKFDYIFHNAAISDTRVYDQEIIFKTNVNSFYDILEIAKKDEAVLIYASSAATYGKQPSPQKIGFEHPENPYGYSKFAMDQIALNIAKEFSEMKILGLRYFNVYGPREFYKQKTASMVIQLAQQILDGKAPRLFYNSQKIFRDFIYIDDVIQANVKACTSKNSGIFNVGSGKARSFKEISDLLQKELNTKYAIDYFQNPYNDYQMHTEADINSAFKSFDFKPVFSLEKGIKSYMPEIIRLHNQKS